MRDDYVEERAKICDEDLLTRLNAHPILKDRVMGLLSLIDGTEEFVLADSAESRVVCELRAMGNELLTEWAKARDSVLSQEVAKYAAKHKKKSFGGIAHMAKLKCSNKRTGTGPEDV